MKLEQSFVVFVSADDMTLHREPHGERFLERVRARAIPHSFAGAQMTINGGNRPRDLAWTAGDRYVVALGNVAAATCREQGVVHEPFPDPETNEPAVWNQIERQLDILASRLPLDRYRYEAIRERLFTLGYKAEWDWAQSVCAPKTADDFAAQAIWVVCCSGFREQAARVTEGKVFKALAAGRSAIEVFPSSGKGRAIDTLWANRERYFAEFQSLLARDATPEEVIEWIAKAKLPYVGGGILRYHFAKNLGISCAKPDRHTARLVQAPEDGCPEENFHAVMKLCRALAASSGDKVGAVDLVLWRACNLGILDSLAARESQSASGVR